MRAGQRWMAQRVLLQADFDRFAALSGDDNPIHCDPAFAATSHFGATVSHGMLLYSCLSQSLCAAFGPGVVALEQSLMFPQPTYAGERLRLVLDIEAECEGVLDVATSIVKLGAGEAAPELVCAIGKCRLLSPAAPWRSLPAPAPLDCETGTPLYGLTVGMRASSRRAFSMADLEEYGDLSGDRNPLFRDDALARARGFPGRIVPWPLLAGMFSDLLGTRLPGRGTGWMKQTLCYPAPAYVGEELTASVRIVRLRADKELVNLETRVLAADGRVACAGEALVLVRNLADKGPKPGFGDSA